MAKTRHLRSLGKKPKKYDPRTLQLGRYLHKLPMPPAVIDHASKMPSKLGMMGNDVYGDCTCAAAGHMIQEWSANADGLVLVTDKAILDAYKIVSPDDDGAYMLDVLNLWRKSGIGTDVIEAFVEVAPADLVQAKLAIQYFGSLYMGMALPDVNTEGPWNVAEPTWQPDPNNGHAVNLVSYDDSKQMFRVCTWGEIWDLSYGWYRKYSDEAYAVLNDISLLKATGKSPEGFDWTALQDDLNHIGDKPSPTPTPTPTPPPVPPPTPAPPHVPRGPIEITGVDDAYWAVFCDGMIQPKRHSQQFEAVQHADALRWEYGNAGIEIVHHAVYKIR